MDRATLYALYESIKHWVRIVAGEDTNWHQEGCALCAMFIPKPYGGDALVCAGCPVAAKSGDRLCRNTPWTGFNEFMANAYPGENESAEGILDLPSEDQDEARRLARLELDFLVGLLPPFPVQMLIADFRIGDVVSITGSSVRKHGVPAIMEPANYAVAMLDMDEPDNRHTVQDIFGVWGVRIGNYTFAPHMLTLIERPVAVERPNKEDDPDSMPFLQSGDMVEHRLGGKGIVILEVEGVGDVVQCDAGRPLLSEWVGDIVGVYRGFTGVEEPKAEQYLVWCDPPPRQKQHSTPKKAVLPRFGPFGGLRLKAGCQKLAYTQLGITRQGEGGDPDTLLLSVREIQDIGYAYGMKLCEPGCKPVLPPADPDVRCVLATGDIVELDKGDDGSRLCFARVLLGVKADLVGEDGLVLYDHSEWDRLDRVVGRIRKAIRPRGMFGITPTQLAARYDDAEDVVWQRRKYGPFTNLQVAVGNNTIRYSDRGIHIPGGGGMFPVRDIQKVAAAYGMTAVETRV